MNNTWLRRLLAAVIVVFGLGAVHSIASAQPFTYTCVIINGVKIIVITNTNNATGSTGSGTFNLVGNPPPPTGPVNINYTPVNLTVSANDPVNGTVSTRLAPGAQPLSNIRSNSLQARFPATGTLLFNAQAQLGSQPGVIYTSASALEFKSTNLNSLPPFTGETFTLSKDVVFQAGTNQFTLKAGSTTVTLGQGGGN